MNKNPFSLYDFLGYLFPGFVAITLVLYILVIDDDKPVETYFTVSSVAEVYAEIFKGFKWESAAIVLVLAYIAGHVVAYVSSIVVEYFTNKVFGYPSFYLLNKLDDNRNLFIDYIYTNLSPGVILCRTIVLIILSPISILIFILGKFFSLIFFIVRPLDDYIINSVKEKLDALSQVLHLPHLDASQKIDYHRIIMHYVYLNVPNCQRKLDNYVAMYGFLRALTLIACLLFDYLICKEIRLIWEYLSNGCHGSVNLKAIAILSLMFLLCNILYLAFVKFYRRFTLENYMTLISDKSLWNTKIGSKKRKK